MRRSSRRSHHFTLCEVMSSRMDRMSYTCLVMISLFVSIQGIRKDAKSCHVVVMVRRGTTLKAAPRQPLTVLCPVKHCGRSLNVTWCKLLDGNRCEPMRRTESVTITQIDGQTTKDELISHLTFRRVSARDDGLYRCYPEAHELELISHAINISVSDSHQGVESTDNAAEVVSLGTADDEAWAWLPYVYICGGIALLVITVTALTLLHFYGCKQLTTLKPTKGQETSSHMLPGLPKSSAPSTPVEQALFVLSPPPPPPRDPQGRHLPPSSAAGEGRSSAFAAYSVISHAQTAVERSASL